MAATDARPVPLNATAFRIYFTIRDTTGALVTTWAGADSEVSLDGAAFGDCTNEATEIGTSGCGYLDLTSAEMTADAVLLKITVTNTGAVPLVFTLYPAVTNDYPVNVVNVGGSAVSASSGLLNANVTQVSGDAGAADNAEAFFDGTGYAGTNNVIPTVTTVTNPVSADVTAISGDATAADNLESYCDGTDRIPVDVKEINSTVVLGDGAGTPWGP